MQPLFNESEKHRHFFCLLVEQNFPRVIRRQLIQKAFFRILFKKGSFQLSCGNIGHCQRHACRIGVNSADIIVFPFLKLGIVCDGSGRDDAHHIPFHQSDGILRILHLLTDHHFIALVHQLSDIAVGRMVGHTAHGRPLFQAAVSSGQGQLQLFGCLFGIVKKHLVKIAEPVKNQSVRILFFHFKILLHHGGKCHNSVCSFL